MVSRPRFELVTSWLFSVQQRCSVTEKTSSTCHPEISNVCLFWDTSLKFCEFHVRGKFQIFYYCGIHISNDTLFWDKSFEYYLIVRYKSLILLAYCEILISSIVSSAWDRNLKYILLWDKFSGVILWWVTNLRYCLLIAKCKSEILLAYGEIQISNINTLLWDRNLRLYLIVIYKSEIFLAYG